MIKCDVCGKPAEYDSKTIFGAWAYLCPECYKIYGSKTKGLFTVLKAGKK